MNVADGLIAVSTTSCLTYSFDTTQLVLTYLNNSLMPSTSKPTLTTKGSSYSLDIYARDQQYLTGGVYQYINVSYAFKSSKSGQSSITYLKLIAFRFIPSLTVAIQQSATQLV